MSIKVFIQTDKFKGGPAIFRSRLISSLNKVEGIKVVTDVNKKFDIELAFIRKVYKHDKPYILRADGCYYQNGRKSGNRPVEKAMLGSKHIIFQSNFSLNLCKKILKIDSKMEDKDNFSVIYNGIDLDYIDRIEPSHDVEPGSFVACARWRDNKRTFSILKAFSKAETGKHLYMIGGTGIGSNDSYFKKMKKYRSKYIHILGEKTNEETISIMKSCDYQIHLCHIDSCPNIVLEGLSCGLNVLCSNLGGTPELVKDDGIILKLDKMWEGRYLSSSVTLDSADKKFVAKGINKILKIKTKPDIKRFNIHPVVKKYVDLIRKNV
jgi:glycosyltransferase involved in cell wall biosynthesis